MALLLREAKPTRKKKKKKKEVKPINEAKQRVFRAIL
jgi:hypothetical protein